MQALDHHQHQAPLNAATLRRENVHFNNTGGISQNNRAQGFLPAFLDTLSGQIHLSRFADGRIASIHLLVGLPAELLVSTDHPESGCSIKATVISGFVLEQRFYTRAQAAVYMRHL